MIISRINNKKATALYNKLRLLSGKLGFELRRKSGTAGPVSNTSDHDMLLAMKFIESTIPRKVWGTVIIRGKFNYHIFYRRCKPKPNTNEYTHVWYTPPKDGGKCMIWYILLIS
jgi:hypothetical protein